MIRKIKTLKIRKIMIRKIKMKAQSVLIPPVVLRHFTQFSLVISGRGL